MPRIRRLPEHEIQKIAAGEVVERPSNVVKELVENAVDAFAKQITVYLEDGGRELIRVVDNGHGMSHEDARLSFEHHTTSKIYGVNDLSSLDTFGFRGEALSSISAVSNTVIVTKDNNSTTGIKLDIQGSVLLQESLVPCPTGTDITITKLFYNIPARKKFLKSRETELRQIQQLLQALSLIQRDIHFKLVHNDKTILNCPVTPTLDSRITQLWDYELARTMLPFKVVDEDKKFVIEGALSHHQYARYDRNLLFFFVNYRWIKNHALARALLKGYQNVLPPARFPAAVISVHIDPTLIDVNIHPRKEEVEFLHPRLVEQLLQNTTKETLQNYLSAHINKSAILLEPAQMTPAPLQKARPSTFDITTTIIGDDPFNPADILMPFAAQKTAEQPHSAYTSAPTIPKPETPEKSSVTQSITPQQQTTQQERTYNIIGQYKTTYILLEQVDGLFIVDQHAAHERILYELFSNRFADIPRVKLLFPHIITLNTQELGVIEPHLSYFAQYGITIEVFGFNQLVVLETPVHFKDHSIEDLVRQTISWIVESSTLPEEQMKTAVTEKLRAQMACKAAVKAGDVLTLQHMQQLLDDLQKTENRLTCPHGRPTGWLLDIHDLEKKFKRKA